MAKDSLRPDLTSTLAIPCTLAYRPREFAGLALHRLASHHYTPGLAGLVHRNPRPNEGARDWQDLISGAPPLHVRIYEPYNG